MSDPSVPAVPATADDANGPIFTLFNTAMALATSGAQRMELVDAFHAALAAVPSAVPTDTSEAGDDGSLMVIVGRIISELGDVYRPRGVWMWLGIRNANLGGEVPAALMATPEGRVRVREEIDRLAGGPRIAQTDTTEESR